MKKIGVELADELMWTDVGDEVESHVVVENGEWIDDGKWQHKSIIFQFNDKYYKLIRSRSGSYFSDWYYDSEDQKEFECDEVEKVEVKTYKWESK